MAKRLSRHKSQNTFKHFTIGGLLAILLLSALDIILLKQLALKPKVIYHGPYLETMSTAPELVLGRSTVKQILITQTQIPNLQPLTKSTLEIDSNKDYGIAAGEGLTSLSQEDLNLYFENLRTLGVKWVRWDFDWNRIQPDNSNTFQWDGPDRVAATSKKYGIKSLGIITYTPKWARDNACLDDFTCQPSNSAIFGVFAGQVALHYKNSVSYWEIWNEPNIVDFFAPKPSTAKYFDLLKSAYSEIKKNNIQSTVISGGLAPSSDGNGGISPLTFVSNLYDLGLSRYSDAIALHPYTYPETPEYTTYWNSWQEMLNIHQLMVLKGDVNKKIWVTELGAPIGGPGKVFEANQINAYKYGADFVSEKTQIQIMTESTNFYRETSSSWMGPFFWYSLRDENYPLSTPENFFGLLHNNWTPKPAFAIFKHIITGN